MGVMVSMISPYCHLSVYQRSMEMPALAVAAAVVMIIIIIVIIIVVTTMVATLLLN